MSATGEVVTALLEAGANLGARGDGQTPLHWAAMFGTGEAVTALLEAGADPNARDNDGKLPFYYAKTTINSKAPMLTGSSTTLGFNNVSRSEVEMERRPTSIRTTLAVSVLALTLIAPWAFGQDPDRIAEIRRQAEQGDARAQFNLGLRYGNGDGVPQDDTEAVRWFRLAAAQGDSSAQYNLGLMYANGEGVLKDDVEAVRWCRQAVAQGYVPAQYNLGVMYANGEDVLKDSVLAHMWFNIAGANGDEDAREGRDRLERDMTRDEISRATELARTCMASNYQNSEP